MAIGSLVVKIVGDASDLKAELSQALSTSENFAKHARAALNAVGTAAVAMGATAAAGLGVMVSAGVQSASEIKRLAAVANASASDFQAMAYAAESVGIEHEKLADILKDVNDRVGDFITTGGGPMADFFERIAPRVGVTVDQFRKLSGPEALQLYVSSLEKANVSQQEMTFFMEAMASDATALIPLLKNGGAALSGMADEAQRLGLVTSDLDIARIDAARVSMANVASISDAFNRQLATEAAPVIEAIAEGFKGWVMEMGGFKKVAENTMQAVATGAGFVGDVFHGWQMILQGTIALLQQLTAAASSGFVSLAKQTEDWRAEIWASVDGLAEKMGVELDLSGAAKDAEANFLGFANSAVDAAAASTAELNRLMAEPLPSDEITKRIELWKAKSTEAAQEASKIAAPAQGSAPKTNGPTITTGESDAEMQKIRDRLKERTKTFDAWRMTQLNDEGQFNASQLALFNEYQAEQQKQMIAAQERENLILADRRAKGLISAKEYNDLQLQLEQDHAAQLAEARAATAQELEAMTSTGPLGFDPLSAEGGDAVRAMQERLQGQADTMAEFNAQQLEMLQAQQDQELAILQARRDAELLSLQDYEDLKAGIEAEGARKRQEIADAERSAKLAIWGSMMDNVSSLMQSGSRKMFEIGKAASVASGLISAYEAVMHAYREGSKIGGPWLGAAYAATAAVAQAANLRKLSSVSFGSSGGSVTASSGGSVPSASSAPSNSGSGNSGSGGAPSRNISISLAGSFFSADTVRELIGSINEQIGDGATLSAG